tara:strand:+ start:409 stop:630 length:222 start_codon:yes stop_codon:yes gene_type:complete
MNNFKDSIYFNIYIDSKIMKNEAMIIKNKSDLFLSRISQLTLCKGKTLISGLSVPKGKWYFVNNYLIKDYDFI